MKLTADYYILDYKLCYTQTFETLKDFVQQALGKRADAVYQVVYKINAEIFLISSAEYEYNSANLDVIQQYSELEEILAERFPNPATNKVLINPKKYLNAFSNEMFGDVSEKIEFFNITGFQEIHFEYEMYSTYSWGEDVQIRASNLATSQLIFQVTPKIDGVCDTDKTRVNFRPISDLKSHSSMLITADLSEVLFLDPFSTTRDQSILCRF